MRELDVIISKYLELKSKDIGCILATVVHVEGSSYRRAGARMLVDEFGNITGAISGGCLEGDALKKALLRWTDKRIDWSLMIRVMRMTRLSGRNWVVTESFRCFLSLWIIPISTIHANCWKLLLRMIPPRPFPSFLIWRSTMNNWEP